MLIVRSTSAPHEEDSRQERHSDDSDSSSSDSDTDRSRGVPRAQFITSFGGSSGDESSAREGKLADRQSNGKNTRSIASHKAGVSHSDHRDITRRRGSEQGSGRQASGGRRVSRERSRERGREGVRSRSRERERRRERSRSRDTRRRRRTHSRSASSSSDSSRRSRSRRRSGGGRRSSSRSDRRRRRSSSESVDSFGRIKRSKKASVQADSPERSECTINFPSLPAPLSPNPAIACPPVAGDTATQDVSAVAEEPPPPPLKRYYRRDLESDASSSESEPESEYATLSPAFACPLDPDPDKCGLSLILNRKGKGCTGRESCEKTAAVVAASVAATTAPRVSDKVSRASFLAHHATAVDDDRRLETNNLFPPTSLAAITWKKRFYLFVLEANLSLVSR